MFSRLIVIGMVSDMQNYIFCSCSLSIKLLVCIFQWKSQVHITMDGYRDQRATEKGGAGCGRTELKFDTTHEYDMIFTGFD